MKGLEERLLQYPAVGQGTDEENRNVYYERLDFELKMITEMGFPGYFMIVADFIQWAKNNLFRSGRDGVRVRGRWWLTRLKLPTLILSNSICCLSGS